MFLDNFTYRAKIRILFVPVFILMAMGLIIVYKIAVTSLAGEHEERLLRTSRLTENSLRLAENETVKLVNLFQTNRTLIEYLYISSVLGGDPEALRGLLQPMYTSLGIDYLQVFDSRGGTVAELDILTPHTEEEKRMPIMPPKKVVSGLIKAHKNIRITAIGPLLGSNGMTIGYIAAGKYINDTYLGALKDISRNELFLSADGAIIARTWGKSETPHFEPNSKVHIGDSRYSTHERQLKDISGRPLGTLTVALSDELMNNTLNKLQTYMFALLGLAVLVSYVISVLFIKALVEPLKKIVLLIGKVSKGEFDDVLQVEGKDEIALLSGHFNAMQKELRISRSLAEHNMEQLEQAVKERTEELELTQKQLLQSQKMEAIGQMAGGVAHDFNNLLTAIMGYGSLLHSRMAADDPLKEYVDTILSASEKAENLTRSLLAFSRKQVMEFKSIDLNETVRNLEKILRRLIREDIELRVGLCDEALTVAADRGQVEQVLLNLTTNARDAMPKGGGLSITTAVAKINAAGVRESEISPGTYALLSVSDTGVGMDEETKEKIFNPFFTTKEIGKGTGLGLSTVYGTIKQHKGHISVFSETGKGSTFSIYLPLSKAPAVKAQTREVTVPAGGSETILVAEDELHVRMFIKEVLEEAGYKVIEAVDGLDAVSLFREHREGIRLVLSDVIMPRKNGGEAYIEIRKIDPRVKVIFMSGYPADIMTMEGLDAHNIPFLSKPLSPYNLLSTIRTTIAEGE